MPELPQRITMSPNHPVQGQKVTICYDFNGLSGVSSVELTISWDPDNLEQVVRTVSPDAHCTSINVPATATSISVADDPDHSVDANSAVLPGGAAAME